jgi:hypothetical protein
MKLRTKIAIGFLAIVLAATLFATMVIRRLQNDAMARVGIFSPKGIECIVFEYAGHFMDPYRPIYRITDKEKISQVYAALTDPNTKTEGAYRMAVIGGKGQAVIYTDAFRSEYVTGELPGSKHIFETRQLFDCEPDHTTMPAVDAARIQYFEPNSAHTIDFAVGSDSRGRSTKWSAVL